MIPAHVLFRLYPFSHLCTCLCICDWFIVTSFISGFYTQMHFSMRIHPTSKRSLYPFVVSLLPHIRKPAASSIYHNTELILFSKKETETRCEKHRIKGADYYLKSTTRIWRRYRFSFSCIIVDDELLPIEGRYAAYESFFFLCGLNKLYNSNSGNLKRDNSPTEIFDVDHTSFLYFICFHSNYRGIHGTK